MKKLFFLSLICLFLISGVFGIEDRTFEIGFNAGFSLSNDTFSARDIFQETFVLDLDELEDGFRMNLGMGASPFYFNYNNKKNGWGFGFSTKVDALGIFNLSGKMINLHETESEDDGISEINGAVFAEAAIPVHFSYNKFSIKIKPAMFYPILYATSDILYTFKNPDEGTILYLGYDVNVLTGFSMTDNSGSILTASPGMDFYLGMEYPISEALGLKDKFPILNFNLGLDLFGIPLFAGVMNDYMVMKGRVGSKEPIKLFGEDNNMDNFVEMEDEDGNEEKKIRRPFKLLFHVDWRPLETKIFSFTVTPAVGFAVSPIYNKPFSMEGEIKATIDLSNIFIISIGTGYHDRLWKNGLDLTLNLRAVEFNLGAALCSQSFSKSWNGSGFALNAGFKVGW
jgi:hypothetical protein